MNHDQKKNQDNILPSLSLVDMIESAKVVNQSEEQVYFELTPSARPKLAVLGLDLCPDISAGTAMPAIVTWPAGGDVPQPCPDPSCKGADVVPPEVKTGESFWDGEKGESQSGDRACVCRASGEISSQGRFSVSDGGEHQATRPVPVFLNGWQQQMLAAADVVCAPRSVLDALADDLTRTASLALAGNGDHLEDQSALSAMAERLVSLRATGRRVLALVSGDPLLHGLGSHLVSRLSLDELDIRPAPSLAQKMAAVMGLAWNNVCQVWLGDASALAVLDSLVWSGKAICLLGSGQQGAISFGHAIRHLLDRGVDWFGVHVLVNGEGIHYIKMEEAGNAGFEQDALLFLVPNAPVRIPCHGLDARQLADHHGKYSSLAARSCALGLLGIEPRHLVLVIGAGNGSLALEAAALAHRGRVLAVEADPVMALAMEENRRRFGAANLDIVAQQAPDLHSLPCPDRVFVAGVNDAGCPDGIMEAVCDAIRPGGRLVAGFDLVQALVFCRASLENAGWQTELCQLQVACSTRVDIYGIDSSSGPEERADLVKGGESRLASGSDFRLVADAPVFLLAAQKPL